MANKETDKGVFWTTAKLSVVVVVMFAFCFVVMVPLYDVLCDALGINGKTSGEAYQAVEIQVDESRTVNVQFFAMNNDGMSWEFKPNDVSIKVHPGEKQDTTFHARNPEAKKMIAQAVPSISPARAAAFFLKTECFCFNQQTLEGRSEVDMPLQFIVDQALPKDIHTITLSYTLFDVTEGFGKQQAAAN